MRIAALATISATLLFIAPTFNANADANASLIGICETVAQDNKNRFRKKIKESQLKLRDVYDGISCSGDNLLRFAMKKGANKTGTFIVKRLPQSHFQKSGDIQWASDNGFAGTEIATAIETR